MNYFLHVLSEHLLEEEKMGSQKTVKIKLKELQIIIMVPIFHNNNIMDDDNTTICIWNVEWNEWMNVIIAFFSTA